MANKKSSSGLTAGFRRMIKVTGMVLLIALGGVLFNLDRLGGIGIELLKVKKMLPAPVRVFLPGGSAAETTAPAETELLGKIIEVYDGDTATLLSGDKKYKIRLYGIDAPEADQSYGIASRDALRARILGDEVRVLVVNADQYGRNVGKVYVGNHYINREMIREGHAWHYAAYARNDSDLAEAELSARTARRGLWEGPNPQPPWEFRHEK